MSYFRLLHVSSTAALTGTLCAAIADRWRFLLKVNAQPYGSTECNSNVFIEPTSHTEHQPPTTSACAIPPTCTQPICGGPICASTSSPDEPIFATPTCDRQPITQQPTFEKPICGQPICDQPICEHPICEHPICGQPSTSEEPICASQSTSSEADSGKTAEVFKLNRRRRPADARPLRGKPSELHRYADPAPPRDEATVHPPTQPALRWPKHKEGAPVFPWPKFATRNLVEYEDFILCYDNQTRTVCWTLEYLVGKQVEDLRWSPPADREETRIAADFRSGDDDYRSSEDRFRKQHAAEIDYHVDRCKGNVEEACVYTNVFPQVMESECHCWTLWNELYDYVVDLSKFIIDVVILTGALYLPQQNEDGSWSVKYEVIGANKVAVPTHFYKVIMCPNWDKKMRLECYKFENKLNIDMDLKKYVIPRHKLEKETGFKIFERVPDSLISTVREFPPSIKRRER